MRACLLEESEERESGGIIIGDLAIAARWSDHPLVATRTVEFLDTPMHDLTMDETVHLACEAMAGRHPLHQTVVNVAKLVNMQRNPELRDDVVNADIINIDGMGVVWGARLFGISVKQRVAGIDLMERLFGVCAERGFRPYLLGAEACVLERVLGRLAVEHPALRVAGFRDGYFGSGEEEAVVEAINAAQADCLFVALPTPRKEHFLRRHRDELRVPYIMGVGGSFDVYGGKVKRAPILVQKMGCEWIFRMLQEPGRLLGRYLGTNARYLWMLWRARTAHARAPSKGAQGVPNAHVAGSGRR